MSAKKQDIISASEIMTAVRKLPHAQFIPDERAQRWVDAVMRIEPDRALWHVSRASGFGGSDVFSLMSKESTGGEFGFRSAYDVMAEKMLMLPPQRGSAKMQMGVMLEDFIRSKFLSEYGFQTDEATMEKTRHMRSKDHPWMRGSLDDFVVRGGLNYLVDYKNSYKEKLVGSYNEEGIPMQYAAQLHLYHDLLTENDIRVDGIILVSLSHDDGVLDVREVEYSNEMSLAIKEGGDQHWSLLMNGQMPPIEESIKLGEEDLDVGVIQKIDEFTRYDIMAKMAAEKSTAAKKDIANLLAASYKMGDAKIASGVLNITSKAAYDIPAMREAMESMQISEHDYMLPTEKLDQEKVKATINALGYDMDFLVEHEPSVEQMIEILKKNHIDPARFETDEYRFAMVTQKKGDRAETLARAKSVAKEFIEEAVADIQYIIRPEPLAVKPEFEDESSVALST